MQLRVLNNEPPVTSAPRKIGPDLDMAAPPVPAHHPLLGLGFRPFFLLASSYGAFQVCLWMGQYLGWWSIKLALDPMILHGHEMLFGFSMAVVAGFLLTAVPNWTGHPTPTGTPLGLLALLWVAARALLLSPWPGAAAVVDLTFLPALTICLASPLVRAKQIRNLIFLPVLGYLWMSDAMIWLDALGYRPGLASLAIDLALLGLVMLIAILGGRVIPFFTGRALPQSRQLSWPLVEGLALASIPAVALTQAIAPSILAPLCWLAGAAHLLRLAGWFDRRIAGVPLLWVLHVGYGWMPVGFLLKGLAAVGRVGPLLAIHAFTVGCVGLLILGMMARVALGHSGRELKPAPATVTAFVLVALAAVVRALLPLAFPQSYRACIGISGALWSLAFLLYTIVYYPVLTQPRADGKPG